METSAAGRRGSSPLRNAIYRRQIPFVLLCGLGAVSTPRSAPAATEVKQVVVLPVVVTGGIEQSEGTLVDDMMLTELSRRAESKIKIIGSKDVTAMLGHEQQKQILGCTDSACLVEIGNALGASHMISTSLGKLGARFVFNLTLLDVTSASAVHRDSLYLGSTEEELIDAVGKLTDNLVASEGWRAAAAWAVPTEQPAATDENGAGSAAASSGAASASDPGEGAAADAQELPTLLWIGAAVGAAGLLATVGFGIATLAVDGAIGANPDQDNYDLALVGLGTIIGTSVGAIALITGGALAAVGLLGGDVEDAEVKP